MDDEVISISSGDSEGEKLDLFDFIEDSWEEEFADTDDEDDNFEISNSRFNQQKTIFAFNVVSIHTKTCQGNENVILWYKFTQIKLIDFFQIYRFNREPFIEKTIKTFYRSYRIFFR